jgi:protein TonB
MATKVNIFSDAWCDMVFEDRNHKYGAYLLRKLSAKRHSVALLIGATIFTLGCLTPGIIRSITPERKEKDVTVRVLSNIDLEKPKEQVDEIIKELPPPPPALRNVVKFTAPVIKADEEVRDEDEPKTQQEVVTSTAAIGAINFDKGTDDANAVLPTTMPTEDQQIVGEEEKPFTYVEQMPNFPGGEEELYKFLQKNTKYPEMARSNAIEGTVYVQFTVTKDGTIKDVKVLRGIGGGCDEEAIRVILSMPRWKPGKQNGISVPVYFNLPVKFTLL